MIVSDTSTDLARAASLLSFQPEAGKWEERAERARQAGEALAAGHEIEAGSDFFLMPSAYEPCGLNQMYSLRYGTLPIVRKTGGLADTVVNYDQETGEGTGFVFSELTPQALYDTVGWALWTWYNRPADIEVLRVRAMRERFSWRDSAARYVELYQWAMDRRVGRVPRSG